jgi:hypothetical protein
MNAEIDDAGSWMSDGLWCVARRIGSAGTPDHSGLLVKSDMAKALWLSREAVTASAGGKPDHYARLVVELARRMEAREDRDRDTMRIWMKATLGLSREDADPLYKSAPKALRQAQMGRPSGSSKVGMSGQTFKKPAEE